MSIIFASAKKQTLLQEKHDPSDEKYYTFVYKPEVWASNKVYLLDSIVIPSVFNGYYYVCVNPGISGNTQPVFPQKLLDQISDSTIVWEARPYDLLLGEADSITSSTWSAQTGVTISDPGIVGGVTYCKVAIASSTLTEFDLVNHTVLTKDGKSVKYDRSVKVKIAEL